MTDKVPQQCTEPELAELFPFYINGHVTTDQREQIETHLRRCPECREDMQLLVDIKKVGKQVFL